MASANGSGDDWRLDPVALVIGVVAVVGIVANAVLTVLGHTPSGALDSIIYVCGGALAGAYGVGKRNGNGATAGYGVGYGSRSNDQQGLAGNPLPPSSGVKAG